MQRVLVVPWSIAAAYLAIRVLLLALSEPPVVGQTAEHAADDRGDDRDPRVAPVRRALARDWQDRVHDARAEVTRRVDGVPRGAAEREPDREHQKADEQRGEAGRPGRLVGGDRQ